MKRAIYILTFYMLAILSPSFGQEHQSVKLSDGSKILKSLRVSNGLVLLTGNEFYFNKNLNWKISYYSPHLTARYDVAVPNPKLSGLYHSFLVASPSGNNVYFVRRGAGGLMGSPNTQNIMRIDSAGISNSLTLKRELDFGRVNVVFADDNYLYYVTKEKDKQALNKHAFPKLQFVRIANDKSVSKIMLALPDPDPDATEWSYLGNTNVVSYFVSRTLDDESYKTQKYRVAVIDHDGKLQDDFKFEVNIKDGKFISEYNYCGNPGTEEVNNHNIDVTSYSSTYMNANGGVTTTTTIVYSPNAEAYGNIMLDPQSNGFYVYGLSGSSPTNAKSGKKHSKKKEDNLSPTGYYVYKFDADGKDVWNYESKLNGIDDYFKSKASFMSRNIALNYGLEGNLRFQAFCKTNATTYDINPQSGKPVSNYTNTFQNPVTINDLGTCHKSGDKTDLGKFLTKPDKGDYSQLSYRLGNNNVVVRNFYKDSKLELYGFMDE